MTNFCLYFLISISLLGDYKNKKSEDSFQALLKTFSQNYTKLEIPDFGFDYRENFKNIPTLEKLKTQKAFFNEYKKKLQSIDYQLLNAENKTLFKHFEYEIKFNLWRIDLEEKFKKANIETIPEGGLSKLPNTKEWYRYYAQRYTSLALSPEELESFGYQEIKRCQTEIKNIQQQLGFANDSAGFYQHLNKSEFWLKDKELIFKTYQQIDQTVRKNLGKLFIDIDIPEVEIKTWPNAGPQTPPGYYNPAENTNEKGVFYFNFYGEKHNSRAMDWLYIHEAIPGHHYQFSKRQDLLSESGFKALFLYPGNFEGWGAYVEYLGQDLGLYQNPYTRLGKWEWDLVRSLRVVLDVGIHYRGWTKAEALAFWKKNIANQDEIAEREVNRCINWNGQVLSYKVGAWKIEQLRQKLVAQKVKKFDIRQFHADYLSFGQTPLTVIEEMMLQN
jgi:uncharacterized protein (DUF885 family)